MNRWSPELLQTQRMRFADAGTDCFAGSAIKKFLDIFRKHDFARLEIMLTVGSSFTCVWACLQLSGSLHLMEAAAAASKGSSNSSSNTRHGKGIVSISQQ